MVESIIRKSFEEHTPINIIYMSERGITQRNIRVIKVDGKTIEAYCYLRKQKRLFKVDNILGAHHCRKDYIH